MPLFEGFHAGTDPSVHLHDEDGRIPFGVLRAPEPIPRHRPQSRRSTPSPPTRSKPCWTPPARSGPDARCAGGPWPCRPRLGDRVGVNPKTIRYYESIGVLPDRERTSFGYRVSTRATSSGSGSSRPRNDSGSRSTRSGRSLRSGSGAKRPAATSATSSPRRSPTSTSRSPTCSGSARSWSPSGPSPTSSRVRQPRLRPDRPCSAPCRRRGGHCDRTPMIGPPGPLNGDPSPPPPPIAWPPRPPTTCGPWTSSSTSPPRDG